MYLFVDDFVLADKIEIGWIGKFEDVIVFVDDSDYFWCLLKEEF